MKIYTKTGDDGSTGLFAGQRVQKDDARIEAYGTVDELNSIIGFAASTIQNEGIAEMLRQVQHDLFKIGAELATPDPSKLTLPMISDESVGVLEKFIDDLDLTLPHLKNFVLPGGSPAAASTHLARTVCRRAERRVISLGKQTAISKRVVVYLNRLSDLLFVVARTLNAQSNIEDIPWTP